jgi:hypothetical protein
MIFMISRVFIRMKINFMWQLWMVVNYKVKLETIERKQSYKFDKYGDIYIHFMLHHCNFISAIRNTFDVCICWRWS